MRRLAAAGHKLRCWYRPDSDRSGFEKEAGAIEWLAGQLGAPRRKLALHLGQLPTRCLHPTVKLGELAVARRHVVFRIRPGGQSQFSSELAAQSSNHPKIRRLAEKVTENPTTDLPWMVTMRRR